MTHAGKTRASDSNDVGGQFNMRPPLLMREILSYPLLASAQGGRGVHLQGICVRCGPVAPRASAMTAAIPWN